MAAERVGRRAFAIEVEPRYVDVAVRRWQAFTGKDAVNAESGETFDQIAARAATAQEPTQHSTDQSENEIKIAGDRKASQQIAASTSVSRSDNATNAAAA
jgi:hypothetical protein